MEKKQDASEVGSLPQLASSALPQLLQASRKRVAQTSHIVLSVDFTGDALESGSKLL